MRAWAVLIAVSFTSGFVGSCADRHLAAAARESLLREERARMERAPADTDLQKSVDALQIRLLRDRERVAFWKGVRAKWDPKSAWGRP